MKKKASREHMAAEFDAIDASRRSFILNVALVTGMAATLYFGINDIVRNHIVIASTSFLSTALFTLMLMLNIFVTRLKTVIEVAFVSLVGILFLILLFTQFPDPAIVFWCFPFPILAAFILGRTRSIVALIAYNLGLLCVFIIDIISKQPRYTYDFAIRYYGAMLVISIMVYYYESMRIRSMAFMRNINQFLEKRIDENVKALRENQERLRQAEKLEAIGLLAGGIAHDFNNQLTGIMAFADLIRINAKDNREIREYAESIIASSRQSAGLTGQLLAFARKGNLLTETVDINKAVREVINFLNHTIDKHIKIQYELNADPSRILGDPSQLENTLLNIALNARDAMPDGGILKFETENELLDESFCKTLPHLIDPGKYLRIGITDTGCGMDSQTLKNIFDPFFTTKGPEKGTGMGLAAVYGIVLSHKGTITVKSELDSGSSFQIYLPIPENLLQQKNQKEAVLTEEKHHGHILLVDDELSVSRSIGKMLELMGYSVTLRANGKEGIEYYKENWRSVDCVILDMVMPDIGGKEAFIAMKEINPDICVLIASGYSINSDTQQILDRGARGFIQKPFTLNELKKNLSAILR